jgi:hypothetical protein
MLINEHMSAVFDKRVLKGRSVSAGSERVKGAERWK